MLILIAAASVITAPAAAQEVAQFSPASRPSLPAPSLAPEPSGDRDIVVTGRRLADTEKAWRDCVAARCPPDKEIAAALTHAENLFVAGDYSQARMTLRSTIGRVDGRAKDYPVQVGAIWRAESRISAHLGWTPSTRISGFASIDALKKGLPEGDARILVQRLENADTFAKQGEWQKAKNLYGEVNAEARRRNLPVVRGYAMLKQALLYAVLGELESEFRVALRRLVREIVATKEPELAPFREAAQLLEAQAAAFGGDERKIDALIAGYGNRRSTRPLLLYTPRYDLPGTLPVIGQPSAGGSTGPSSLGIDYDGQWADLTFVINADGRVVDVESLRESATMTGGWLKAVVEAVGKRRYAPLALDEGSPGMRRVERFTMVGDRGLIALRSRIPVRGRPRIETLDLTVEPSPTAGAQGAAPGG